MHDVDQLQRWMQTVIMNLGGAQQGVASEEARQLIGVGPEDAEQVVTRSQALTALERLDIYNRAYFARLLECLREEFPTLLHALGEEAFDDFAIAYLHRYPSRSYTLNQLGVNFPRYLAETRPEEGGGDGLPADLGQVGRASHRGRRHRSRRGGGGRSKRGEGGRDGDDGRDPVARWVRPA